MLPNTDTMKKEELLLSFATAARNDQYMGNSNWRLETALNYIGSNLEKLNRLNNFEFIVTDWGSEIPLRKVLKLSPAAQKITRFISVEQNIALELNKSSRFNTVLPVNIAFRRSRGKYIAYTCSDILYSEDFLKALFEIIDGKRSLDFDVDQTLFLTYRRDIPQTLTRHLPDIFMLDWCIHNLKNFLPYGGQTVTRSFRVPIYKAAATLLMHRKLWYECGAFDERLIYWGWSEIDLMHRVASKYSYKYFDAIGVPDVFHLDHKRLGINMYPFKKNEEVLSEIFNPNPDSWGLKDFIFEENVYSVPQSKNHSIDHDVTLSLRVKVRLTCWAVLGWAQLQALKILRVLNYSLFAQFRISVWKRRIISVTERLKGKPVLQWPVELWHLWLEGIRRWRGRGRL
ncbi:MAG: glycosyltransferase family A protein [Candidatus Omnitrophica bacterium]|nr:glycosyltransferase family A protein [Candidatus Omnitrophota bacterium]